MPSRFLVFVVSCLLWTSAVLAQVNINTASQQQLDSLKGIGPSKAKAIVNYRKKNGPFRSVEELRNVPGIGEATLQNLRGEVSISGASLVASPAVPQRRSTAAAPSHPASPVRPPAEDKVISRPAAPARPALPSRMGEGAIKPASQPASQAASASPARPAAPPAPARPNFSRPPAAPAAQAKPAAPAVVPTPAKPAAPAAPAKPASAGSHTTPAVSSAHPPAPAKPARPAQPPGHY